VSSGVLPTACLSKPVSKPDSPLYPWLYAHGSLPTIYFRTNPKRTPAPNAVYGPLVALCDNMSEMKLRLLRSAGDHAPRDLAALMYQVARGDEQAFSAIYDELSSTVYGVALRVVRNPAMAEEITQEAFVEMWRAASRFDENRGSVRGWAATITHRKAVDRVRSEQARTNREDRDHARDHQPPADIVTETIERAEDRSEVLIALDTLTENQREAVTLAYFGGNTYREVALLLDTPEGTVKTRIRDGLTKMRDQLGSFQ